MKYSGTALADTTEKAKKPDFPQRPIVSKKPDFSITMDSNQIHCEPVLDFLNNSITFCERDGARCEVEF